MAWVLPPDGHTVLMPVELHTTPVTSRWQGDPSGVGFAHPPSPCPRNSTSVTQCSSARNLLSSTQRGSKHGGGEGGVGRGIPVGWASPTPLPPALATLPQ